MTEQKSYSVLILLPTFIERFEYLKLRGSVGAETFGCDRIFNQRFYNSTEWKRCRNRIIARDLGCDLGVDRYDILGRVIIHHINPINIRDIETRSGKLFDEDNLICVSEKTHEAIHYGDSRLLVTEPVIRRPNDMCPWKKGG